MTDDERARLELEALNTLHASRASLLGSHGFLATLAMQVELVTVWDFRLPTAATDARRVYVRPDWLLSLSFEQRTFVLAHEVMHCAMLHFTRVMSGEHRLWNLAWDHEVNDLLIKDGLTPPQDLVWFPAWSGQSAEQVYNQLLVSEEEAGTTRSPNCDVHLGQPLAEPTGEGDGDGKGGVPLEIDPRFLPELERDALDAWPHQVRVALNRGWGTELAVVERLITRNREAVLPWRSMLAAFVTRASGGSSQWLPPARRHVHRGVYLPSRRHEELKIAVAIDTSGSTTPDLPAFLAELAGIVAAFPRYELTVIACDMVVHSVEVYSEDRPLSTDAVVLGGGGGTDLRPPFAWIEAHSADVDVMVYLTDGFGPAPEHAPPWPVLWVLVPDGKPPAPWAQVVWMGRTVRER
jgi:predicted metal-dependent peptidase